MRKILFLGILILATQYLQAQTSESPKYISTIEGIKEYSLQNGMQVLLISDASQSNMVTNIIYRVGSRHEGYGEKGMAHLLEHMLFKSTKKLGDIKKMLSDNGGQANGTTWNDRTNYYEIFAASDEKLKWSIEMEADRMINATILQSDLDKEFSVVRNEFEIGESYPQSILMERLLSTAYLWHNYGNSTIGSKEDIERVKAERLRLFYEKYYQPDNATLVIAGKFDEAKALNYISEYFAPIPKPNRILEKTYTQEPPQDGERFVELKRNGDVQYVGAIYHTAAFADKDYAAVNALMEILQADPSGSLYKALVESHKSSNIYTWSPNLRDPGYVFIGTDVPKDKDINVAKTTLANELNSIATKTFTEEDLKRGKAKLMKQNDDIMNNTIRYAINFAEIVGAGDYKLWFLNRDNIENLKIEDLNRVAKKYFSPNNRTLGLFIPSNNEERVKPAEINDDQLSAITKNYKGKTAVEEIVTFDANIPNIKKNLTQTKLANGFTYSFLKKPIKGKKVVATLKFPVGNEKSLEGKKYISSLMANMLKTGTKTMTKEQIQDQLDGMKSSINFYWRNQSLFAQITTYQVHLQKVMDIAKKCLTESTFPESELVKTKTENKTNLESQLNDPQAVAFGTVDKKSNGYAANHIFYSASPKEIIENETNVTQKQIVDFFNEFAGSNNGNGTVVGDLDKTTVDEALKAALEKWNSKAAYTKIIPKVFDSKAFTEKIQINDKENGVAAAGLNIKINQFNPDYAALMMANEMLGSGGFLTSRIPIRLREKEGISYGAGSYLQVPSKNEDAFWGAYAFYNPSKSVQVDASLRDEISKAISSGFTTDELKSSKVSWQNSRNTDLGNDNFLINMVNNAVENDYTIDEFDNLSKKVNELSVEKVNEIIKKYINLDKMILIHAGDFLKKDTAPAAGK